MTSWVYRQEEEPMLSIKHGAKIGGCFVIQHQTEETMASVLLAGKGEDSKVSDTKALLYLS